MDKIKSDNLIGFNNGLILGKDLKMENVASITEKRVKHLKISELEVMLSDIPTGYKKAIVGCLKTIFTEKKPGIIESRRSDLAQLIEQVVFINMQKEVQHEIDTAS